jgi:hypothetical protein
VNTRMNMRGGWLRAAVLVAAIGILATVITSATPAVEEARPDTGSGGTTTTAPSGTAASAPHVVKVETKVPPRRKVVRRRFRPSSRPSPRKVRQIIRLESRRWHISASGLARRVACESHFHWWAGNGAYQGLLQFSSSTFHRGLRTIRTRAVKFARKRTRRVRETRLVHYSDGHVERERGRRHRQVVVRVYKGRLPRRPSITHGWTQIRIGAQAIRGLNAVSSSEWSCSA